MDGWIDSHFVATWCPSCTTISYRIIVSIFKYQSQGVTVLDPEYTVYIAQTELLNP